MKKLKQVFLEGTAIKDLNMSGCINLVAILCKNSNKLKSVDLTSTKLQSIGWSDSGNADVKYLSFPGCVKAEIKLPNTVTEVLKGAFGEGNSSWCSKVIVPTQEIKNMVIATGYPQDKIILQ